MNISSYASENSRKSNANANCTSSSKNTLQAQSNTMSTGVMTALNQPISFTPPGSHFTLQKSANTTAQPVVNQRTSHNSAVIQRNGGLQKGDTAYVNTQGTSLRSSPAKLDNNWLANLDYNTWLKVTGRVGNWIQVVSPFNPNQLKGFVSGELLTKHSTNIVSEETRNVIDPWGKDSYPYGPLGYPIYSPLNNALLDPNDQRYFAGTAKGVDIANGNVSAAEANAYYDKFSKATAATGILSGVQGLKADALEQLVRTTTGEVGSVKALSAYGKAWGIIGVAAGGVDLYYAFSDGDVSGTDVANAIGVGLGIVGIVASGPVGWIASGISLGIGIWGASQ